MVRNGVYHHFKYTQLRTFDKIFKIKKKSYTVLLTIFKLNQVFHFKNAVLFRYPFHSLVHRSPGRMYLSPTLLRLNSKLFGFKIHYAARSALRAWFEKHKGKRVLQYGRVGNRINKCGEDRAQERKIERQERTGRPKHKGQ